jgi:16S rRNA G966 N2-methylase RsmD
MKTKIATANFENRVRTTMTFNGTFSKPGSRSWYAENLSSVLHEDLFSYEDAQDYCNKNKKEKVYVVYLRRVMGQNAKVKIGKGVVYFKENRGKAILTRDHTSADENPLETDVVIPCKDSSASLTLEGAVQRYLGKDKVHKSLITNIDIIDNRWLKPKTNSDASSGGEENFNFADIWESRIEYFKSIIKKITKSNSVNKRNFNDIKRYYQEDAGVLICEWLLKGGDPADFFLLMKPRAGKNSTAFLGLSKFIQAMIMSQQFNEQVLVDFLSMWPSAFAGAIEDLKKYLYVKGINIAYVNTQDEDYQTNFKKLKNNKDIHCIIRFASMQSIDSKSADSYNNDEEREGTEENFEPKKVQFFKQFPADICLLDESDHGLRTDRSSAVIKEFNYKKRLWMSGTDLYAIRELIEENNHFIYDIFNEIEDVRSDKIERRPLMKKYTLKYKILPFDDLTELDMGTRGIARKLEVLCKTTKKGKRSKIKFDKVSNLFLDENSDIIKFEKLDEFKRLWEHLYYYDVPEANGPKNHRHIFCCMSSVAGCFALYNHIQLNDIQCDHSPLLANMFGQASTIEQRVNDEMKRKDKTIFITVGRMLRGAKAPWSCVMRFDNYSDFKIGLQLELRAQNTDEEYFEVYDANVFRCESQIYELIRSRTNGKKIDSEGKKLFNHIPMMRKGEFEIEHSSWEDIVDSWVAGRITEGFKKSSHFDATGIEDAKDMLSDVPVTNVNKKSSKDKNEGNSFSKNGGGGGGDKDKQNELLKKAMTIGVMLPILVLLTEGKYTEIDELVSCTDDKILREWLKDKCGVKNIDGDYKLKLIRLFRAESINQQLSITAKKIKNDTDLDWEEFSNPKNGDVITPRSFLLKRFSMVDLTNVCSVLDVASGSGEFIEALIENGFQGEITVADKLINILITEKRLKKIGQDKFKKIIYNTVDEFKEKTKNMNFDIVVGNPPYTKGDYILYAPFFERALELGRKVYFVMPVAIDSQQVRLKAHNERLKKHLICKPENVSEYFNIGLDNIHFIEASRFIENTVEAYVDPLDSMPLLYPDRKRIIPVRGFGAYSRIENRDTNGDEVYTGILRTGFKIEKIKKEVVQQDRKKDSIDYLYLVMIGENPSNGIFNIEVIKNENKPYGSGILAVGVDNLEIGLKLKEWLLSLDIQQEVKKMLDAKGSYSLSGPAASRLPWYE